MALQSFLAAPVLIQSHALAALLAGALGAVQLIRRARDGRHRWLGWLFVAAMGVVTLSSFWIHEARQFGSFSVIHILSVLAIVTLLRAIVAIRRGQVGTHARNMKILYFLALVLAGVFTLLPGRLMHQVLFGT